MAVCWVPVKIQPPGGLWVGRPPAGFPAGPHEPDVLSRGAVNVERCVRLAFGWWDSGSSTCLLLAENPKSGFYLYDAS